MLWSDKLNKISAMACTTHPETATRLAQPTMSFGPYTVATINVMSAAAGTARLPILLLIGLNCRKYSSY